MFINQYWLPQKPVIITNYPVHTQSSSSPSSKMLAHDMDGVLAALLSVGHKEFGVKLSPSRDFEGIDDLLHWTTSSSQSVPRPILDQMVTPDQVVVRAAHATMSINDYLHLISKPEYFNDTIRSASNTNKNSKLVYAYVEYQDMQHNFPELLSSLLHSDPLLGSTVLNQIFLQRKPYLWLGDGDTLGKLHFDQYDNLLIQLQGSKTFRLIDPQRNERMMEGHMREAQLEVQTNDLQRPWKSDVHWSALVAEESNWNSNSNSDTRNIHNTTTSTTTAGIQFRKHELLEATSMVHSPLEFTSSRAKTRFPWSSEIAWMDCTVNGATPSTSSRSRSSEEEFDSRNNDSNDNNTRATANPCNSTDYQLAEALFVPSYFWHEVLSAPGPSHSFPHTSTHKIEKSTRNLQLNVALNYWFAPLYDKEFPCAKCRKKLNPQYRHILETLFAQKLIT